MGFFGGRGHGKSQSPTKGARQPIEELPVTEEAVRVNSTTNSGSSPTPSSPSHSDIPKGPSLRLGKSHSSLSPKNFRLLLGTPRSKPRKTRDVTSTDIEKRKSGDDPYSETYAPTHHTADTAPGLSSAAAAIQARTMEAAAAELERLEMRATSRKSSNDTVEGPPAEISLPDRPECTKSPQQHSQDCASNFTGPSPAGSMESVQLSENWMIDHSAITLGKTIGHSSFGRVNEGRLNGTKVAVKTISRDPKNKKGDDIEAFKKEAELNCKLRHPNVVLFMGICVQPTEVCIVTELMARGNVHDLLVTPIKGKSVKLEWSLRLQWAIDTAQGMAYLHSLNPPMIHRDLKTTNLLVDRGMNVKICDFGLSRFQAEDKIMSAVGTVQFAAPEVLRHEKYTEKADLFSYGTVLWELHTRKTIFQGLPQISVYKSVVDGDMPEVGDSCDPRYAQLVKDCWQLQASQRPSFREVLDRLAPLSEELCTDEDL